MVTRIRDCPLMAVVGSSGVGKSSIINALTQSQRVIVSPIPGTTRDAVDVPFEVETEGERRSTAYVGLYYTWGRHGNTPH